MSGTLNGPSHPTCRQRSNSCQSVAASSASYLFSCRRRCVVTTGQHNLWQIRYLSALRSLTTLAKAPTLHPRSFTDCRSDRIRTALLVGGRPHLLVLLQLRLVPVAVSHRVLQHRHHRTGSSLANALQTGASAADTNKHLGAGRAHQLRQRSGPEVDAAGLADVARIRQLTWQRGKVGLDWTCGSLVISLTCTWLGRRRTRPARQEGRQHSCTYTLRTSHLRRTGATDD